MAVTGIEKKVLAQVCIIVEDVERSAAQYAEILGFPVSTEFQITRRHDHTQATYYGSPTDARAKINGFEIGSIQFELLQPLEGPSTWKDYLDQHGEGIHHIAFFVPKTDVAASSFVEHGYTITQQGLFTGQTGMYTYLDTDRDLGVVIELLEHFSGVPQLSGPPFPADKGLGTDIICQVGLIVHDIERTAQRYSEVLGLPQPEIMVTPGYEKSKTTYKGEPSEATAKLAFFDLGQLQLELIEPDEKPSVWRDFLEEKGEGAQHIAFQVKDTGRATEHLGRHGIEIAQQGLYADGSGMYTYLASDAKLGTTLELLENFDS
jgi:catechol 2,3-dioxygenase-like lactoylglutathione lyase family enzyme